MHKGICYVRPFPNKLCDSQILITVLKLLEKLLVYLSLYLNTHFPPLIAHDCSCDCYINPCVLICFKRGSQYAVCLHVRIIPTPMVP